MPIRTGLPVPECPQRLPVGASNCVPGVAEWNKMADSQRFLNHAGRVFYHATGVRINNTLTPIVGNAGSTFNESTATNPFVLDAPETWCELLPGMNRGLLTVTLMLQGNAIPNTLMNQVLEIFLVRGATTQTVKVFAATTGAGYVSGNVVTGANQLFTNSYQFTIDGAIMPNAGTTELVKVIVRSRKFNPRGTVVVNSAYFDGAISVQLKQFKSC